MVSYCKKSSAEWFIDQLNVENAKLVALVLVIGFIGYHGILHLRYGPDSCTWLLTAGRFKGDHEWQPYGCMLHKYSKTDARRCLRYLAFWGKYNSFAFIGDSKLEELYEYFIDLLKTKLDIDTSYSTVDYHMPNYTYEDSKLRLSVTFIYSNDISKTMVEQFRNWQRSDKPPSVIVATTGLQLLKERNATDLVLEEYKRNITLLVQPIDSLSARNTKVLWKLIDPVDTNDPKHDKGITNADIDAYNRASLEVLSYSAARPWAAARLAGGRAPAAQMLLNMYCNDHMNFNDGSCCAQPEPCTTLQMLTFAMFLLCAVFAVTKRIWAWSQSVPQRIGGYNLVANPPPSPPSPITALAKLGMIMGYFYLCDRTNFFMKENKYYSEWSFWLPVGYVFALGLFFTDDSGSSKVLHRAQTGEWKGWMQLVVLASQVTGARKVLPIYMLVRTLASSYLFLLGYGHFTYIWKTGDLSLVRYFRVIFRMNFFTVVLCLTMNRPYQFYSFIPLVSFWYTLMFVIFALPPQMGAAGEARPYQHVYLALKVLGMLTIVTVLYMSEVFFQKIFVTRPWKALFVNSDDDIRQWWLRWKQDRYSTAFGIVAAAAKQAGLRIPEEPRAKVATAAVAILGLSLYLTFVLLCGNPAHCAEVHSYVAFLPILGYIVLRNISTTLRSRHSTMFAWFGAITLELFASQSHIWLAADTHGVLVLIPSAPTLNLMLSSYIFVCAAHEIHKLTGLVLPYAVPDDWRTVLRNLAIFMAVLVPIGIHDGMF